MPPAPQAVDRAMPEPRGEPHQSPATKGEPHQSPVTQGDYLLLLPPPPEGDHQLLSPRPPEELKLPPEGQLLPCPATPRAAAPAMPRAAEPAMPGVPEPATRRDGEQWKAWEQQHHQASLPTIAAMDCNYLAADMGMSPQFIVPLGAAMPILAPQAVDRAMPKTKREPHQSPATKGEPHQSPATKGEPHQSPATGGEPHQSPVIQGDYLLLLPPPPEGDHQLLSP
ncbi:UNVERIFIED_CONTAM: hypothetical protein FKN15_067454 [Acipenser sinensis]